MLVKEFIDFRRNSYYKSMDEELIHTFNGRWQNPGEQIEIYKNPKSLKRMGYFNRAISDSEGNIWVADTSQTTHSELLKVLYKIKEIKYNWYHPTTDNDDFLVICPWQRYRDSNDFYLSESLGSDDLEQIGDQFLKFAAAAKKRNPKYNFIVDIITQNDY